MSHLSTGEGAALTDAELVGRCRSGDAAAWNLLVERFSRYVYAIASQGFRLTAHDAEDVFQDVFAKVYEHLERLRDDTAIRPWIAQLTRRTCIDRLRAAPDVPQENLEPADVEDLLLTLDDALSVRAALETLPEQCRDILDRFFARDESYAVISEALDVPAGTVASRISRCLEKLKVAMEETVDDPRLVDG